MTATLIPRLMQVGDLVEPFVIAHRGGANVFPENTIEAFRAAANLGIRAIELGDVHKLRDGGLGIMHDTTLDRTTTTTGSVSTQTTASWPNLTVDPSTFMDAPGYPDTRAPLFEDALSETARGCVIFPEAKQPGAGEALTEAILRHGLQASTVIQADIGLTSTQGVHDEIGPAQDAGIQTMVVVDDLADYTAAEVAATGARYAAFNKINATNNAERIAALVAVGVKPVVYTINRRSEWTAWQALGCVACFSDDPHYISGNSPVQTTDGWGLKTWPHGFIADEGTPDRGVITSAGKWQQDAVGNHWVLQGYACPVAAAAGTYSITLNFTVDEIPADTTRFIGLVGCAPTDARADGGAIGSGYLAAIRVNGTLQVWRRDPGATSLGTASTAAITVPTTVVLKLDVTPTTVKLTRSDVGPTSTSAFADTAYRGGYFTLGKQDNGGSPGLKVTWNSVTVA